MSSNHFDKKYVIIQFWLMFWSWLDTVSIVMTSENTFSSWMIPFVMIFSLFWLLNVLIKAWYLFFLSFYTHLKSFFEIDFPVFFILELVVQFSVLNMILESSFVILFFCFKMYRIFMFSFFSLFVQCSYTSS